MGAVKFNLIPDCKSYLTLSAFKCRNCAKCFSAPSGLRQHFKRHDTCRLTAVPGAYSIKSDELINLPDKPIPAEVGQEQVLAEISPAMMSRSLPDLSQGGVVLGMAPKLVVEMEMMPDEGGQVVMGLEEDGIVMSSQPAVMVPTVSNIAFH